MKKIGIRALKQNASSVVARAARGEMMTITDRGRPVAQIVPLSASRVEALIASDRARPALRRIDELPVPVRRSRRQPAMSEELEEMRRTERY